MMHYAICLDQAGHGIGCHAYAEAPAGLPPDEMPCTAEQAANPGIWMRSGNALVANPAGAWAQHQTNAHAALRAAERVALRCYMAGQPFPAEWVAHAKKLRAIVAAAAGTPGTLPTDPAIPTGV